MNDPRSTHPWWNRRDFFKTGAALAAGAYGLGWRAGHADEIPQEFDGSKFQLKAPEPNPKSGGWHHDAAAAFRRAPVGNGQQYRQGP
jgi:hypothetical protein